MIELATVALLLAGDAPDVAEARLNGPLAVEVETLAHAADAAGLPGERLRAKAQEGLAKGVVPERILAVLAAMRRRMDEASALLGGIKVAPEQRRTLVGGVAGGLETGVPVEAVKALVAAAQAARRDAPTLLAAVRALTDLVGHGYASVEAQKLVLLAMERGFGEGDFAALVGAVNELGGRDDPGRALQAVYSMLRAGERPPFWVGRAGQGPGAGPPGIDKGPSGLPVPYLPRRP